MVFAHLRANPIFLRLINAFGLGVSNLEREAASEKVDVLIFGSPNHLALGIHKIPIATTVWDFGHLDLPQAAETSLNGLWAWRHNLYSATLRRSAAVFCDSQTTSERLQREWSVDVRRIKRVGLIPSVSDVEPIFLEQPHFIYPAMFWPHKNHELLLRSFRRFLDSTDSKIALVFTGSGANESKIRGLVQKLDLTDSVFFEGLVSRERLLGLVRGSLGLLMPSLLGPSNLPPLEAALLGVPSVISDAHAMDDLLANVTYAGAYEVTDWEEAMKKLIVGEVPVPKVLGIDVSGHIGEALRDMEVQLEPWRKK